MYFGFYIEELARCKLFSFALYILTYRNQFTIKVSNSQYKIFFLCFIHIFYIVSSPVDSIIITSQDRSDEPFFS